MINEHLAFGIDIGIASCGWAVLDTRDGGIEGMGTWMFDAPENPDDKAPLNQQRRAARLVRRTLRRRRERMVEIRRLLEAATPGPGEGFVDPWECRARGLDELLSPEDLARSLLHIAKHRGFKSNARRAEGANEAEEEGIVLTAIAENRRRMVDGGYRTAGEMFHRDPRFADRKRNRTKLYDRSIERDLNEAEARRLFAEQRRRGNPLATQDIEAEYLRIAFRQLPRPDSEHMVGACRFEPGERRAAMRSPSFEEFRMLQKLTSLRLTTSEGPKGLSPTQIAEAHRDWGVTPSLTYAVLRERCALAEDVSFTGLRRSLEGRDVALRKSGGGLAGMHAFRTALGEDLWRTTPRAAIDAAAAAISFREERDSVVAGLHACGLPPEAENRIVEAWEAGSFSGFRKAASLSALAARKLVPHMASGLRYDEACAAEGYDHSEGGLGRKAQIVDKAGFAALVKELDAEVASPTARKALIEALKQVWAMRNRWGLPGSIRVELARDVGKGPEERDAIRSGIEKATEAREKERKEAAEQLGCTPDRIDGETFLKYRLWKEQGGKCCYTGSSIPPDGIASTRNEYQVDHILPWSRFHDNSFVNKGLCIASANQAKGNSTPYEWIYGSLGKEAWRLYEARIETSKELKGIKKRNYLIKDASAIEETFRSRNLNDTRFTGRLFMEAAAFLYPFGERGEKDGRRRVRARPGQITSILRNAWGVESLKKVDGKRVEDNRHHALDAAIVAATDEAALQSLTRAFQQIEALGSGKGIPKAETPWPGFRDRLREAYDGVRPARPERRRARGKAHGATIRRISSDAQGKEVVIERKIFDKNFKAADLERLHDPISNAAIMVAVREWIDRGKPLDDLPRSPKGDPMRKVSLVSKSKPALIVRGGATDRDAMVRIDVFVETTRTGGRKWHMVPIYNYQAMSKGKWPNPPSLAVAANKPQSEWPDVVASGFAYEMSLYPKSYVRIRKGETVLEGYISGLDISNANLGIKSANGSEEFGIGTKTVDEIVKFQVDRFGNLGRVGKETRTWHGEACM